MDDNNKLIVKNTIYLYIRMLVIMALKMCIRDSHTGFFVEEENDNLHQMMADFKEYGERHKTLFYGRPECCLLYTSRCV